MSSNPATASAVTWKAAPAEHDYPAAADYLDLILPDKQVQRLVGALRTAPQVHKKAKDIERASGLPLLPAANLHVAADLNPTLLMGGD